MSTEKINNKKLCNFFFHSISGLSKDDKAISKEFTYRCGVIRKQVIRSGFSNLTAHIFSEHLDWHEQYKAINKSKTILNFISKKNTHIYSWLD